MDLLHLVDRLEELVASAQRMPIGSRAIVDRRRLLDIIDQMRVAVPGEVREARELVESREAIRRDAEEEARLLVARAEERAAQLTEEHEISRAARARAGEIAEEAELRIEEQIEDANADIERRLEESRRLAEQQMAAADTYARELLTRLDRQLEAFQGSVRSGLDQLEQPSTTPPPPRPASAGDPAARTDAILAAALAPDPREANGVGHDPAPERSRSVLGSLMGRPAAVPEPEEEPPAAAEPGVIDDFAMPALDDQPADELPSDESPPRRIDPGAERLDEDPQQHNFGF